LREARDAYEQALKLDPHSEEAQKALEALPK
jgi:cytochrome c-type biogenesis protein CcmH/NrfG